MLSEKSAKVYVYENRCPHTGTPLDWQPDQFLNEARPLIQCSTHGALFRIEAGYCVFGPCASQFLRNIPYEIRENQLIICISQKSPLNMHGRC